LQGLFEYNLERGRYFFWRQGVNFYLIFFNSFKKLPENEKETIFA